MKFCLRFYNKEEQSSPLIVRSDETLSAMYKTYKIFIIAFIGEGLLRRILGDIKIYLLTESNVYNLDYSVWVTNFEVITDQ